MENVRSAKNLYEALQKDNESVLFANEKITSRLLKKVRKSSYEKVKVFLKLYNSLDGVNIEKEENIIPAHVPFVEKKSDVDRSTM